jgi:hypothetical protein
MRLRIFVLLLFLAPAGCGPKVAPVSGKVMLDDRPLVNATVIFAPDSEQLNPGPGSKAKTDQNGQFSLELMTGGTKGAIVGKHIVSITAYEGDDKIPSSGHDMVFRKLLVPERYNAKTELTFDVPPGGSTSANFDLKSDADTVKK